MKATVFALASKNLPGELVHNLHVPVSQVVMRRRRPKLVDLESEAVIL